MKHSTNTNQHARRLHYLLPFLLCVVFSAIWACNTTKKTQAQKEADSRQKYIDLINDTRKQLPCDTVTTYINVGVPSKGPQLIEQRGDTVYVTNTIYQNRDVHHVVIDSALAYQRLLEIRQKDYYLGLCEEQKNSIADELDKANTKIKSLETYKTRWMWLKGIGIALIPLGAIWAFRKPIFSLLSKFI